LKEEMTIPNKTNTSVTGHAARTFVRGLIFAFCLSGLGFAVLAAASQADDVLASLSSHHGPLASAARVKAPSLSSPDDDAVVDSVPAFSWKPVKGAVKYEFQLSADEDFGSVVLGRGKGSFQTLNTFASVSEALPNGHYFWRARSIDRNDDAGPWSRTRSLTKSWTQRPELLGPAVGSSIHYPQEPLVLHWSIVPHAYKYLVEIATDPSLGSPVSLRQYPVETSGNVLAIPGTLLPGQRYYWAVTPLDAQEHRGARSSISDFTWEWQSEVHGANWRDLNPDDRMFDPQLYWDPVPGAAHYEVDINSSNEFSAGSRVCCTDLTIGTSLSPMKVLPNNHYYWRVRAFDLDGNAGVWKTGPEFTKDFDKPAPPNPTIPNLALTDNVGTPLAPGSSTSVPIVVWDPVPGASSYDVEVVPYDGICEWGATGGAWRGVKTASTAWTPLGDSLTGRGPGSISWPSASSDGSALVSGQSYCVKLAARGDRDSKGGEVVSGWTYLGGEGNPAFTYQAPTLLPPPSGALPMPDDHYGRPYQSERVTRTPFFTWLPVDGAASYFVVVSKDASFTNIVDVGFTKIPAYAPRRGTNPKTYPDETTNYYWAVMPAKQADGGGVGTDPLGDHPHYFQKQSIAPTLGTVNVGPEGTRSPQFNWSAAEGARTYRLQVAQDDTFSNIVEDVTTDATSYTSSTTYPADADLYWRVRANDETGIGLSWSSPGIFRRRLPAPVPSPDNPTGGTTLPRLTWSSVQGATSYTFHVDQPDGQSRDLRMGSTAGSFVIFYGTGVWRWQVRANFPKHPFGETPGPFSAPQTFTRRIDAPTGASYVNGRHHLLFQWDPNAMVKDYRVQLSTTDSFTTLLENDTTDNTNYAPKLRNHGYENGGSLYWRVAAMDEGRNLGAWTTRALTSLRAMSVRVRGFARRKKQGLVTVTVVDAKRHPLRRARVRVSGAGVVMRPKSTGKKGVVRFKVKPRKKGRLVFRAVKGGFRPAQAAVKVR
jgi:hypothetical protein